MKTQLYAMIKKDSDHYAQQAYHVDKKGKPEPFEITVPHDNKELKALGGVGGNYDLDELNIFVKINHIYVRLK